MSVRKLLWGVALGAAGSGVVYKSTYESYVSASNAVNQAIFTINPTAIVAPTAALRVTEDAHARPGVALPTDDGLQLRRALSTAWNDAIRCAATTTITTIWLPDGSSRLMHWVEQQSS